MLDLAALEALAREAAARAEQVPPLAIAHIQQGLVCYPSDVSALAAGLLEACRELRLVQSGEYPVWSIRCHWCGKTIQGWWLPDRAKELAYEHVKECNKHPLAALRRVCAAVNNAPSCSPAIWTAITEAEKLLGDK